jgi:hypothetical protein
LASEFPVGENGHLINDGLAQMLDQRKAQFVAMRHTEKQIAEMAAETAKDLDRDIGPYSGEYNH